MTVSFIKNVTRVAAVFNSKLSGWKISLVVGWKGVSSNPTKLSPLLTSHVAIKVPLYGCLYQCHLCLPTCSHGLVIVGKSVFLINIADVFVRLILNNTPSNSGN